MLKGKAWEGHHRLSEVRAGASFSQWLGKDALRYNFNTTSRAKESTEPKVAHFLSLATLYAVQARRLYSTGPKEFLRSLLLEGQKITTARPPDAQALGCDDGQLRFWTSLDSSFSPPAQTNSSNDPKP